MPNFAQIDRYVLIAASSGHFNNLKPKTRLAAKLLFHGWQPVSVAVKGYWPTKLIGFGEDLPAGVARQWRRWCSSPGYVENSFGREIQRHHYSDINILRFGGDIGAAMRLMTPLAKWLAQYPGYRSQSPSSSIKECHSWHVHKSDATTSITSRSSNGSSHRCGTTPVPYMAPRMFPVMAPVESESPS